MNSQAEFNIWKIRQDFPLLQKEMHGKPLIYFDSAATSQKPQSVIHAISHFYSAEYGTVHRAVYDLAANATARYEEVRHKIKTFLNAEFVEEIIFTKGTTEAINLVAHSFGKVFINAGDEILISETEHHSNIVPWQILCEEKLAILKVIPVDDLGQLILTEYEKLLTNRTKLVSIAHIANATGTIHPIELIIELAHAKGAKVFIDGAQAASHIPVDVRRINADFYAFSGHKAYGPTGIGVLYGRSELLKKMPPFQYGGDMIEKVTFAKTTFQSPPLKFEAGTPLIAEVIGLGAAIDYIESIGRERIAAWENDLLLYTTKKMASIPHLRIIGTAKKKGAIISFVIEGLHSLDIGTLLDIRGIAVRTGHHCAQPAMQRFNVSATTRLSLGVYNTMEEVNIFIEALKEVIFLLRPTVSY